MHHLSLLQTNNLNNIIITCNNEKNTQGDEHMWCWYMTDTLHNNYNILNMCIKGD